MASVCGRQQLLNPPPGARLVPSKPSGTPYDARGTGVARHKPAAAKAAAHTTAGAAGAAQQPAPRASARPSAGRETTGVRLLIQCFCAASAHSHPLLVPAVARTAPCSQVATAVAASPRGPAPARPLAAQAASAQIPSWSDARNEEPHHADAVADGVAAYAASATEAAPEGGVAADAAGSADVAAAGAASGEWAGGEYAYEAPELPREYLAALLLEGWERCYDSDSQVRPPGLRGHPPAPATPPLQPAPHTLA